jgi:RNA polymerase sigma-70 factor (sigma-E family)
VDKGAGDDEAASFDAFVRASGTQLYRTAYLLCGDHHLAEDLTQSTYAKVFARWRRLVRSDNPVGYARTTLINTYLSHRRLRRNTETPTEAVADAAYAVPSGGPDGDVLATRHDLIAALRQLSALDRAVLVARFWEDRSVAETATDLGISAAAVKQRSHRALARLRPHVRSLHEERTGHER